ncbi:hydroxysteroid 11-beta-dehydrogenase 1-like protein [Ptychodera flava]|uniref:hydroxysteroid 11-beta-dehydrogenase 1-like protein n=1 Tax=Ptychodera flava TaxID=63121 RepID=UPI00396A2681
MDMAEVNDTEKLIEKAEKILGGLDYLVLNHALYYWEFWDGNIEKLQNIMNVNFVSFVSLASKALPMLTKANGSIVVVSSSAGLYGTPAMSSYCATKHALGGFFEALRQELIWKKANVAITYFIPGFIGSEGGLSIIQGQLKMPDIVISQLASPDRTALALVKSAAARKSIAYYPWIHTRPFETLHTVSHELADFIISQLSPVYLIRVAESQ